MRESQEIEDLRFIQFLSGPFPFRLCFLCFPSLFFAQDPINVYHYHDHDNPLVRVSLHGTEWLATMHSIPWEEVREEAWPSRWHMPRASTLWRVGATPWRWWRQITRGRMRLKRQHGASTAPNAGSHWLALAQVGFEKPGAFLVENKFCEKFLASNPAFSLNCVNNKTRDRPAAWREPTSVEIFKRRSSISLHVPWTHKVTI